jgi:hypothetical protein
MAASSHVGTGARAVVDKRADGDGLIRRLDSLLARFARTRIEVERQVREQPL